MARITKAYKRWPNEIHYYYNNSIPVSFEIYKKYNFIKSRKLKCQIQCIVCNNIQIKSFKELSKRTLVKEEVCNDCVLKVATSSIEWRKKNSEAQLKIQSTLEQKMKNALGVSNFWLNNPEKKKIVSDKLKAYYQNKEFKNKYLKNNKVGFTSLSGTLKTKYGNLKFDSSYELCFLLWTEKQIDIKYIDRVNFWIPYLLNEKIKHYQPDFIITKYDNSKILIEIKSSKSPFYNKNIVSLKENAALSYIKENNINEYKLINEDHILSKEINFIRTCRIRCLCKILYSENRLELSSNILKERYIGKCGLKKSVADRIKEKYLT